MSAHLQKQLTWQMDFVSLLIYQCSALHKPEAGYDACIFLQECAVD